MARQQEETPQQLAAGHIKHDKMVSFTGTSQGMTAQQRAVFEAWLDSEKPDQLFHGACVGADEQAVVLADQMNRRPYIIACPGYRMNDPAAVERERSQVAMELSDLRMGPQTMFARNRHMVLSTRILVATPWQGRELEPAFNSGGGTWFTIHYAMRLGRPIHIIWPGGDIELRQVDRTIAMPVVE